MPTNATTTASLIHLGWRTILLLPTCEVGRGVRHLRRYIDIAAVRLDSTLGVDRRVACVSDMIRLCGPGLQAAIRHAITLPSQAWPLGDGRAIMRWRFELRAASRWGENAHLSPLAKLLHREGGIRVFTDTRRAETCRLRHYEDTDHGPAALVAEAVGCDAPYDAARSGWSHAS